MNNISNPIKLSTLCPNWDYDNSAKSLALKKNTLYSVTICQTIRKKYYNENRCHGK